MLELSRKNDPLRSIAKRIYAGLIVGFGTCLVLLNWLFLALHSFQTGWDFPVFYIAAKLPIRSLYDVTAFRSVYMRDLAPLGVPFWAPYIRPSAFAVLLHPLAYIPYTHAMWLWMLATLCAYLAAVGLLIRRLSLPAFFLSASAAFFPALVGIISAQDAAFYLLCFTASILLLEREMDAVAGLVLVLCLCKFHLVLLIPWVLIVHKRYKALFCFGVGGAMLAGISLWLTPLGNYLSAIAHARRDTPGFYPVGLRGFSVAIGQPWCYSVAAAIAGITCCWLVTRLPLLEGMSVAITGALLISPYIAWYDSTSLLFPLAVIFARGGAIPRWSSLAVLIAIPLWRHGGGNNGPIGFMHVGVEVFIIWFFLRRVMRAALIMRTAREQISETSSAGAS